ncbi:MAG: helix-turn-helix domain-containing protein [Caulobacter sp.]
MTTAGRIYGCPVELTLSVIGGKWSTVIMARLKQGDLRYGELRRLIPTLSDKMLSQRLRELQEADLVTLVRDAGDNHYSLTERGAALGPALWALYEWGEAFGREKGVRYRDA